VEVPILEPFAGLRYDPSIPLDDVIAPPYDVVGPRQRALLADRHPANSIHVELPVDDTSSGTDRYQVAAEILGSWVREGVVLRDSAPCLYSYQMTEPNGATTNGVIGALGCDPAAGDVLPHEQTIPKDMSDRLDLLRACRANLSPIWGLSLTEGLSKIYAPSVASDQEATDDSGVLHRLWVIDDPATIESVTLAVAESPVVIADGHHRYDTAGAYRAERRAANHGAPGGYDSVMALVVELAEEQLSVGAIHRVLSLPPGELPAGEGLVDLLRRWFECERVGDPTEQLAGELVAARTLALLTPSGAWALSALPESYEAAGSDLDSSLVSLALVALDGAAVSFVDDWRDAARAVSNDEASAAFLLRPVTVTQISAWARSGRRMPPKSTYFHPKPRTGMVFRTLEV